MTGTFFIASRLRYKKRIVSISITISYMVMIIALAISSGFRKEIRSSLSEIGGDIQLTPVNLDLMSEVDPVDASAPYLSEIRNLEGVESVAATVSRVAIVKSQEGIHGVLIKGVETNDSVPLSVTIPARLSKETGLVPGDRMLTYFVGEKIKARNFTITSVYDPVLETDENLIVYADVRDLQRLNGWESNEASVIEVRMKPNYRTRERLESATENIGAIVYSEEDDGQTPVFASSVLSSYPQLFDWLDLIDFNVIFVLVLMIVVAGFNMISGLLITLFENISTIGVFKAMGMTDRGIAEVFLASSMNLVFKGMLAGNALAILFCMLQGRFHILKLDPSNYFVSFVPVNLDLMTILLVNVISLVAIGLFLLLPCMFISKVDPAETVSIR